MMVVVNQIIFALRGAYKAEGVVLSSGHAYQMLAAALGHHAYHLLLQSGDLKNLSDAEHVVMDLPLLEERAAALALPNTTELVRGFRAVLEEQLSAKVHFDEEDFGLALQDFVDDRVFNDDEVSSQMAMTNGSLGEIYMPVELDPDEVTGVDDLLSVDIAGHVEMDQDPDRVFYGTHIDVEATLTIERHGRRIFGSASLDVTSAKLLWFNERPEERDAEDRYPEELRVPLAEALAELLGIDVSEAGGLEYDELLNDSDDGLPYSRILDFSGAPPAVAEKIRAKHGSLQVHVATSFFEDVRMSDSPR